MTRVTRSSSKKAKVLENSEIIEDKTEEVAVPTDSANETRLNENDHKVNSESESDGDEAPESIPLTASKEAAIAEIQKEKETVKAVREKEKQRRRERDEILKQQKELRKARELARLPAEILEKVAQKQKSVAKQQKEVKGASDIEPTHITFDSDDDNDAHDDDDDDDDDESMKEPKGLQVVVLHQASKNVKKGLDSASEFLKNHFYGDRLKRVGTLDDENQKRKRKKLEPAIKFCKTAGNE